MGFFKDSGGGGGMDFIKLKSGDSVKGVFMGNPYEFYAVFKDKNEYDTWANGRSYKFRVNFIVKEGDQYVAKVLQGGRKMQAQIETRLSKHGMDCVYEIERIGSTKDDTTYTCIFVKKLTDEEKTKMAAVKLQSLSFGRSRKDPEEEPPPPTDDDFNPELDEPEDEDIPF